MIDQLHVDQRKRFAQHASQLPVTDARFDGAGTYRMLRSIMSSAYCSSSICCFLKLALTADGAKTRSGR